MKETETWEGEGGATAMPPAAATMSSVHRMEEAVTPGSIFVQEGIPLPPSLLLPREPFSSGWSAVTDDRTTLEKEIERAGWTFFYMAGEIKITVLDFDRQKAVRGAWKLLVANLKSQHCNSVEITRVTRKSFLRVPYVTIYAHARHLQKGAVFQGKDIESDWRQLSS